ncbi:hypothetical protein OG21DRAFT_1503918 [Imleria badia]|nr:hypothetical protein OG21DRAFT_1503918 [Imleria badia]
MGANKDPKIDHFTTSVLRQDSQEQLHNSGVTVMKVMLKTPVAANSKPTSGFPTSRGEFEHNTGAVRTTRRRFEGIRNATQRDTAAKREALHDRTTEVHRICHTHTKLCAPGRTHARMGYPQLS